MEMSPDFTKSAGRHSRFEVAYPVCISFSPFLLFSLSPFLFLVCYFICADVGQGIGAFVKFAADVGDADRCELA